MNQLSYNDAVAALEKLVAQIEADDIQLDDLAAKVREAGELVKYCTEKLRTIEADVQRGKEG